MDSLVRGCRGLGRGRPRTDRAELRCRGEEVGRGEWERLQSRIQAIGVEAGGLRARGRGSGERWGEGQGQLQVREDGRRAARVGRLKGRDELS